MPIPLTYTQLTQVITESATLPANIRTIKRPYLRWVIKSTEYPFIKVLQGIRRSGKSTILKQFYAYQVSKGTPAQNILFLNFENPLLAFCTQDTELRHIFELFLTRANLSQPLYVILDEVQEVKNWERFVRWLYDTYKGKVQIFVTGSNSKLLSSEFSTLLAGRHISNTIYPFSFKEVARFYGLSTRKAEQNIDLYNKLKQLFNSYFMYGGMPEIVGYLQHQPSLPIMREYLTQLLERIISNDIVKRYQVQKVAVLHKLAIYLLSNVGKTISLRNVQKILKQEGYTVSVDTLSNYVTYLESTFLIYRVPRFDYKTKQIFREIYKYYTIDNGFIRTFSIKTHMMENNLLENLVFLHYLRKGYEVFYLKNGGDIDFIVRTKKKRIIKIQVTYALTPLDFERELGNFVEINKHLQGTNLLVTYEPLSPKMHHVLQDFTTKHKIKIRHKSAMELA